MPNILIAEDEDVLRRNLTFIMNSSGYTAISARTSTDAIEQLRKRQFDVVITDLVMPVMGGGELIKFIFDHHPDVAVIIITAYPTTDSAINAVKTGVFDYFTKPFKTEDILDAVKRAIEKRKEVPFTWEKIKRFDITKREESLLRLLVEEGVSESKDIADRLGIKTTTVKHHLENLYNKFNVNNRTSLISVVIKALRQ
ncbi:MAG: DNA-binding response regulator [Nitrospiraceae bacterium]|nr:MAG: DNA-binding response regulator [Nitrospiraceae bacterium]